jgi:hypothetical protein
MVASTSENNQAMDVVFEYNRRWASCFENNTPVSVAKGETCLRTLLFVENSWLLSLMPQDDLIVPREQLPHLVCMRSPFMRSSPSPLEASCLQVKDLMENNTSINIGSCAWFID